MTTSDVTRQSSISNRRTDIVETQARDIMPYDAFRRKAKLNQIQLTAGTSSFLLRAG